MYKYEIATIYYIDEKQYSSANYIWFPQITDAFNFASKYCKHLGVNAIGISCTVRQIS